MRLALALLAVACVAGSVAAGSAFGCSCVAPTEADLRERYAESEGALVGRLVARRTIKHKWSANETDGFTFAVEEDLKGTLGGRVEVRSSAYGASCGLEVGKGYRVGLFVWRVNGSWWSNLCNQVSPRAVREAARPLPAATGSGSPMLVAGGMLGEPRLAGFDADGQVVKYGMGRGSTEALDVCSDGQLGELGWRDRGPFVTVRDSSTLRKQEDTLLRLVQRPFPQFPRSFACRGEDEPEMFVLAAEDEGPSGTLLRIRDGEQSVMHRGRVLAAAFDDESAYLYDISRHRLLRIDLDTGGKSVVLRDAPKLAPIGVSPDGERLLAYGYTGIDPTYNGMEKLYVLTLTGSGQRHSIGLRRGRADATAAWVGNDSIGLFDTRRTKLLDGELETDTTLPGLPGLITIRDNIAYGLANGILRRMDLATGERSVLTEFPVDGFSALVGIDTPAATAIASGSPAGRRCYARVR